MRGPADRSRPFQRRVEQQRPRAFDLNPHLDEPMLDHLEIADRLAELLAVARIVPGHPEKGFHGAKRLGADMKYCLVHRAFDAGERLSLPPDKRVGNGPSRTMSAARRSSTVV